MKNIVVKLVSIGFLLSSMQAFSVGDAPEFLKGGTITVTLKNGKQYQFSADEYAVVRRGTEAAPLLVAEDKKEAEVPAKPGSAPHKNILSVGLVNGQRGLDISQDGTQATASTKRETGIQIQYQRHIKENVYVGGQVDTNQSVGINVGVGF